MYKGLTDTSFILALVNLKTDWGSGSYKDCILRARGELALEWEGTFNSLGYASLGNQYDSHWKHF